MSLQILMIFAIAFWVINLLSALLALVWGLLGRRFWACVVLAGGTLLSSYWAMHGLRIVYTVTENGVVVRHLDSRVFFLPTLALGALALAVTLLVHWLKAKKPAPTFQ